MSLTGLSLLEILISVVILALLVVGMSSLFISAQRLNLHSRSRVSGAELGKAFMDPMHSFVRADTWMTGANCLSLGNCPNRTAALDRNYTASYAITNNNPALNVNRVTINITWNE